MTKFAVVAFPTLEDRDRQWIDVLRAREDPQAALIGQHFTLVFPADLPVDALAAHVATVLQGCTPIPFVIHRAEAVRDALGSGGHVLLVPDEGRAEIVALHDRLYGGPLRPYLRADIPFLPHITVGASVSLETCERFARKLNDDRRLIPGVLQRVDIVEVGGGGVRSIKAFTLAA